MFIHQHSSTGRHCLNIVQGGHSADFVADVDRGLTVHAGPVMSPTVHDSRPQGVSALLRREMRN